MKDKMSDTSESEEDVLDVINDYKFVKPLGTGSTSHVDLYKNVKTNKLVAMKIIEVPSGNKMTNREMDIQDQIKMEIVALQKVKGGKNCLELYDVIENDKTNQLWLSMEYCSEGDLMDKLDNRLSESDVKNYFAQLLDGVKYIHSVGVVHRDLKPENLLFNAGILKISDFGWAGLIKKEKLFDLNCGTEGYAPPEVLLGKSYDGEKVDIWSCGMILYSMLTGCFAFDDEDISVLIQKMLNLDYVIPKFVSEDARDLLKKIIVVDPLKRLTVDEIRKHKFLL
jgi:serine/threonine protein kinase